MAKYSFYEDRGKQKVICVTTYAGRIVKGTAKCSPDDDYAYEKGTELAMCRADVKVADKRVKRANEKLAEAKRLLDEALDRVARMEDYLSDAEAIQEKAYEELARVKDELK